MDQLNQLLALLGPWGPVAGAAVVLVANYLRSGKVLPVSPAAPVTPVPPAPVPDPVAPALLPVIPNRPLLNLGLQLLPLLAQRRAAQAVTPPAPFGLAAADPFQALEDEVLKRVAAAVADPNSDRR